MSHLKNGESLGAFSKWIRSTTLVFSATLAMMTGLVGSASAAGFCCDPCEPVCCDMPDYVLYADFLYWQTHEEGLAFARSGYNNDLAAVTEQGKLYAPECEWEPGFRVGAVVDLGCCEWDFFAQYTWMHPCRQDGVTGVGETGIEPLILSVTPTADLTAAAGSFELRFNVLDFGLGRTFNCNECFMFRPHFGFKATWQEHKNTVVYQWGDAVTPTVVSTNVIQQKMDFDGIGLRAGFDAAWKFSPCFSVVGNFAVSTVWSDIELRRNDSFVAQPVSLPDVDPTVIADQKFCDCAVIPVVELFLGVRWDSTVCDCYDTYVRVGWENQVWLDTNRFIRELVDSAGNHGNLTFQGLTLGAGFGF